MKIIRFLDPKINPILTIEVIKLLVKRNIFTIIDYMKEDTIKLSQITHLSVNKIILLKETILSQFGPTDVNGFDLFNEFTSLHDPVIKTGIDNFDNLLDGGGLTSGHLYEVCGLSAAGKTQICKTIAVNLSINDNWETLYIDAKNDFSAHRIYKMLQERNCSDAECGLIMERITCVNIYDVVDFMKVLGDIPSHIADHKKCKFIVVDSLPALWFAINDESTIDRLSLLTDATNLMRRIAIYHHIIFLLVNIVTRRTDCDLASEQAIHFKTTTTVALGKYWNRVPLQRFLLSTTEDSVPQQSCNTNRRIIRIIKGSRKSKSCLVNITNKGVVS